MSAHLFSLLDLSLYDFNTIFDLSENIKNNPLSYKERLKNQTFAFLFKEETLYGRLLLGAAISQMGGTLIPLPWSSANSEERTTSQGWHKNLEDWVNGWIFCGFSTDEMKEMTSEMTVPVLNAGSDKNHPCRILSDFFTIKEARGTVSGLRICYTSGRTNLCSDLIVAAIYSDARLILSPLDPLDKKYTMPLENIFPDWKSSVEWSTSPADNVNDPDVIYISGQREENKEAPTTHSTQTEKTTSLEETRLSSPNREITLLSADPFRGPGASLAAEQLKNQLHVQKAIMLLLLDTKRR